MAKKKNVAVDEGMNTDGNRAINKFRISDAVMMLILVILCATCVLPFIHLLAKSISGNAYVIAKQVAFWPKGINFDAYASIFKDGGMVYRDIYCFRHGCMYLRSISSFQEEIKRQNILYIFIDVPYVFQRRTDSFLLTV